MKGRGVGRKSARPMAGTGCVTAADSGRPMHPSKTMKNRESDNRSWRHGRHGGTNPDNGRIVEGSEGAIWSDSRVARCKREKSLHRASHFQNLKNSTQALTSLLPLLYPPFNSLSSHTHIILPFCHSLTYQSFVCFLNFRFASTPLAAWRTASSTHGHATDGLVGWVGRRKLVFA